MVRIINIECPHCSKHSEIYLSIDPKVIILNCPECSTPLVLEDSGVKIASRELDIHKPSIKDILDTFRNRNNDILKDKEFIPDYFEETQLMQQHLQNFENSQICPSDQVITQDDITNLKIDLASVYDINELIEHL